MARLLPLLGLLLAALSAPLGAQEIALPPIAPVAAPETPRIEAAAPKLPRHAAALPQAVPNRTPAVAAPAPVGDAPLEVRRVSTPQDAGLMALLDSGSADIDPSRWPGLRYVWVPSGEKLHGQALSLALNMTYSHMHLPLWFRPVPGSAGQLFRVDLLHILPDPADYKRVFEIWEEWDQTDAYFHIQLVKEHAPHGIQYRRVATKPYKASDGKTYDYRMVPVDATSQANGRQKFITSEFALHTRPEHLMMLRERLGTNTPILRFDALLARSLDTLNGGRYHDLLNIQTDANRANKKTDLDVFLEQFGASLELIQKNRSDNRVGLFRSHVTAKPRRVDVFPTAATQLDKAYPLGSVTYDIANNQIDPKEHPIRNLADLANGDPAIKATALEVILTRRNGTQVFGLFNGDGLRQDKAPDNVVKDHEVPAPHTAELVSGISCIRCHAKEQGWLSADNNVRRMLSKQVRDIDGNIVSPSVLDDLANVNQPLNEVLDAVRSFYSGKLDEPLRQARNSLALTVYRCTGGLDCREGYNAIAAVYNDYVYEPVTPRKALLEMGFDVPEDFAVEFFDVLVPPLPTNSLQFAPDDPVVMALRSYVPGVLEISRFEWEQIYPDVMLRSQATLTLRPNLIAEFNAYMAAAAKPKPADAKPDPARDAKQFIIEQLQRQLQELQQSP